MRILITGSNGYIGAHACEVFGEANYVIGVGRKAKSSTVTNEYICCDFATDNVKKKLETIFEKGIDVVLHLAADNRREPFGIDVIKSNCIGTQALLELSEEYNTKAFIQLSSVPVIGSPREIPITLKHSLEPPTIYHATKRMQELLADYASRKTGLRCMSIRIPSPMGPGVNPRYIFPTFIRQAIKGEDIKIYGEGSRKQTYVHVKDICRALEQAIESDAQGVYLLGSPYLISNYDLAKKVIEVLESKSKIVFTGQEDIYDGQSWEIDYSPLKEDIGYLPKIGLEEMILEYSEYLKRNEEIKK